jgi:hypothetical protein
MLRASFNPSLNRRVFIFRLRAFMAVAAMMGDDG